MWLPYILFRNQNSETIQSQQITRHVIRRTGPLALLLRLNSFGVSLSSLFLFYYSTFTIACNTKWFLIIIWEIFLLACHSRLYHDFRLEIQTVKISPFDGISIMVYSFNLYANLMRMQKITAYIKKVLGQFFILQTISSFPQVY